MSIVRPTNPTISTSLRCSLGCFITFFNFLSFRGLELSKHDNSNWKKENKDRIMHAIGKKKVRNFETDSNDCQVLCVSK